MLLDQIILRSAKDGVTLDATNWHALVKQGSHVCQAMILHKMRSTEKACAFPNCDGSISSDGSMWYVFLSHLQSTPDFCTVFSAEDNQHSRYWIEV